MNDNDLNLTQVSEVVDGDVDLDDDNDTLSKLNRACASFLSPDGSTSLKVYMQDTASLPVTMHDGLGNLRRTLMKDTAKGKWQLMDVLKAISSGIAAIIPIDWILFARDVSLMLVSEGSFDDSFKDIFGDQAGLELFCSMRTFYTIFILNELNQLHRLVLDHEPTISAIITSLTQDYQKSYTSRHQVWHDLVAFDMTLAEKDASMWAEKWKDFLCSTSFMLDVAYLHIACAFNSREVETNRGVMLAGESNTLLFVFIY